MNLLALLRSDVARQDHFAGRGVQKVSIGRIIKTSISPRFVPILLYRLAYWSGKHHLRPLAKLFSLVNFIVFGLEIGIDCEIGPGLYLPHTSGTVIGAGRIGANAVIYQNVTVGAKTPDLAFQADLRPELGNGVFLGAGCKVLGGIILGDDVVVGANSVVLKSVASGCLVGGVPAMEIKRRGM